MAKAATAVIKPPVNKSKVVPQVGNVEFIHPSLENMLPNYYLVRDCVEGEATVKARRTLYLPQPNPTDKSPANMARYADYVLRAVFYNVTKRTLAGLNGQVFLREPVIEVPAILDPVIKDANGSGVSLEQLSSMLENWVLSFGRAGILTDYPTTNGPTSRADQVNGNIRPTLTIYEPWNIINWRTISRGGRKILSLVVIRESYEASDDEFEIKTEIQYRVLRLVNNIYTVEVWRKPSAAAATFAPYEVRRVPLDSQQKPLDEIPFTFVGAVNNDPDVDPAPLYDLASLNIAHYRNSADYEDSVYIVGQPTPFATGLTESWVREILKNEIQLGSRAVIPLPQGGDMKLLEPAGNGLVQEAMEHKERQMVALGAKLVEQKTVQRTATESKQEEASEASVLQTVTKNVSAAVKWSLEWAGLFAGAFTTRADAQGEVLQFELNTEFDLATASPEELKFAIEAWQKDAITYSEMRVGLRKAGVATLDDTAARKETKADNASGDFDDPADEENEPGNAGGGDE